MKTQTQTQNYVAEKILRTYKYGSRLYGCATEKSDHDYVIIVDYDGDLHYNLELPKTDACVYSEFTFIKMIRNHDIVALECIFQNPKDPYAKLLELDLDKLRRSISSKASHSFVKAKKKILQGDYHVGKKSLFHSLRILNFGMQIAKYGKIVNYSSANSFCKLILNYHTTDWIMHEYRFKPIYNGKKSIFKKLAPLKSEEANNVSTIL